jgi:hypothetical protein
MKGEDLDTTSGRWLLEQGTDTHQLPTQVHIQLPANFQNDQIACFGI